MGHAAGRGDAGQEPHQPDLAPRIGDRGHELIVGPSVEEDAEGVKEGTKPGKAEATGEGQHVLFGHPHRQELFGVAVAKAVDLAARRQVGGEAEDIGMAQGVVLEGARIGAVDHFDHRLSPQWL